MELRRLRAGEERAVGELTVAAYEPFLIGPEDDYRDRLSDVAGRDRDGEVWVAAEDAGDGAAVLGSVTLCPAGSPWREIAGDGEGEFRMLAVDPAAQGRGVGRALVTMVLDRFRAEGAHAVVLSSLDSMAAAHALYVALGFGRVPTRDWSPMPGVDLIAFERALP